MEQSIINDNKLLIEKGLKKLDLNSIKSLKIQKNRNEPVQINLNSNDKEHKEKENYIENLITKDYEMYMEFLSQEDLFTDKMVNLQDPYYYMPINHKKQYKDEKLIKYSKENEDFFNKLGNKFSEKSNLQNSQMKYKNFK